MKPRLHPSIICALIAAYSLSFTTSAQTTSKLQSWEIVTPPAEDEGTSLLIIDDSQSPAPIAIESLQYLQLADGTTPTFHKDAKYVSENGELLSSSDPTSYIIDPITGLRVMMASAAVTTEDITFRAWAGNVTFKTGTIIQSGNYDISENDDANTSPYPMIDRDMYLANYKQFSTATGSEIYLNSLWGWGPTLHMGKVNQDWGSATAAVSTEAIIDLARSDDHNIEGIIGGNTLDAHATKDTTFHGSSTIILLDHSNADFIVGGSWNMENSTHTASFNGDVRISLQDSTHANVIVGGNSGHGGHFNGNVNIAVHSPIVGEDGNAAMSITGANRLYAASDSTFVGNTNILINSTLAESTKFYLYGSLFEADNSIIGGYATETDVVYSVYGVEGERPPYSSFHSVNYEGTTAQLTGNTNIEFNFENKYQAASVGQAIIGGSVVSAGLELNHDGGSKITITGAENVGFYNMVVGGNLVSDISNGVYTNRDNSAFPYVDRNNMASAYIKSVEVNVDSGDFTKAVEYDDYGISKIFTVGSMSAGGGNVETGSTKATITGGSFHILVGGNSSVNAVVDFDGMGISDFSSGATTMGNVNLSISGENTSSMLLVGGSYISDYVTDVQGIDSITKEVIFLDHAASVGNTNVSITGGSYQVVTAGSYVGAQIAQATANGEGYLVTQGNLELSLKGQSNIYYGFIAGAGIINGINASASATTIQLENAIDYFYSSLEKQLGMSLDPETFDPSTLSPEDIAAVLPPSSYAATIDPSASSTKNLNVRVVTESTSVEIGSEVTFHADPGAQVVISGGYLGLSSTDEPSSETMKQIAIFYYIQETFKNPSTPEEVAMLNWADSWLEAINADAQIINTMELASGSILASHATVTGNRELVFSDQNAYSNLANVSIIEFDEVETAKGAVVDFAQNQQDLDLIAGRNSLSADGIHVVQNDFSGTNTLRKTGQGVLKLSDTNGQINGKDNLQLVVEEGSVVLAQNSAGTDKTNFKTLVVQAGATLDMKAGDNTEAGAAGINGHLNLEKDAIIVADAGRFIADSGTSMDGGKLTVNMDFILSLDNTQNIKTIALNKVQFIDTLPEGSSVAPSLTLGAFEIVLFSDLEEISGITFYDAIWGSDNVQIAFAGDYISHLVDLSSGESLFISDENGVWENHELYLVWKNNDLILTSGAYTTVPEPSTATLSLLALAGLLSRRRRKAA